MDTIALDEVLTMMYVLEIVAFRRNVCSTRELECYGGHYRNSSIVSRVSRAERRLHIESASFLVESNLSTAQSAEMDSRRTVRIRSTVT